MFLLNIRHSPFSVMERGDYLYHIIFAQNYVAVRQKNTTFAICLNMIHLQLL